MPTFRLVFKDGSEFATEHSPDINSKVKEGAAVSFLDCTFKDYEFRMSMKTGEVFLNGELVYTDTESYDRVPKIVMRMTHKIVLGSALVVSLGEPISIQYRMGWTNGDGKRSLCVTVNDKTHNVDIQPDGFN